jgi:hypothetical protein
MRNHLASLAVLSIALIACSPSAAASASTTAAAPTVSSSAPPSATPAPATPSAAPTRSPLSTPPPGTTAWPGAFDIEVRGTYWSSPPFRIPFEITIDEPGWYSAHLHDDFLDFMRFDDRPHQFPNRMVGFADPEHVRGGDGEVAIGTLTPEAALELLAARASLATSNAAGQELFGLFGKRMDLHSATNNNPLFGAEGGDFGLGPELDVRLVVLPRADRLLVVLVLAAPGDLDGAWEQALPILETVRFAE